MTKYATTARRHWEQHAPARLAALEDPETFFRELGEQIQGQVTDLADDLAGPDLPGEDYLAKTGRLTAARTRAEEAVLTELLWSTRETAVAQAREEWEQTRTPDSWLATWAERIQAHPDLEPATAEIEALAAEWALSPRFLSGVMTAPSPREHLRAHAGILAEAANLRFLREQRPD
jgi:hypothetical protein